MTTTGEKKFGIKGSLPESDPMRSSHLLGSDWEWYRWYETETERDQVFQDMISKHPYYRIGDYPSQILNKIER
jgi:hypothetical protein